MVLDAASNYVVQIETNDGDTFYVARASFFPKPAARAKIVRKVDTKERTPDLTEELNP